MAPKETPNLPVIRSFGEAGAIAEFEQILLSGEKIEAIEEAPEVVQRRILEELLNAGSDAELFSGSAIGWRELTGLPVELTALPRWRPSQMEEGGNVFFVQPARRLDNGESVTLTTGAGGVLAQLINMAKRGTLVGAVVKIEKNERPTGAGYYPLHLELVTPAPTAPDQDAA